MIKILPAGIVMESPELKYPIHGTGAADARRVKLKLHNANVFAMVFFMVVLMFVVVVVIRVPPNSSKSLEDRCPIGYRHGRVFFLFFLVKKNLSGTSSVHELGEVVSIRNGRTPT